MYNNFNRPPSESDYNDCYEFEVECVCKCKVGVYAKSPEQAEEYLKDDKHLKEFDYDIEEITIEDIGMWTLEV